jgi:hypothetical protein
MLALMSRLARVAVWVLLAAIIAPGVLSADDLPEIRARGVLRVAIHAQMRS